MKIYAITMFENFDILNNYTRCVGYTTSFEEAEKIVKENICDISEGGNYNYAMIEAIAEGIYPQSEVRFFFEYDFDNAKYVEMDEPEAFKGIYNFAIG